MTRQKDKNFDSHQATFLLALHSSSEILGVAVLEIGQHNQTRRKATFSMGRNLSKSLFTCVEELLPASRWAQICRIAVAIGPGGFTSNRLTVVMARTLAQQLGCYLDGISSFALMAPRLAVNLRPDQLLAPFWIFQPLKRRGIVAGKYQILPDKEPQSPNSVAELEAPQLLAFNSNLSPAFQVDDDVAIDVERLLEICLNAHLLNKESPWSSVRPIYPTSPVS